MDILICAVPYVETEEAIMAPALLKAAVQRHGFKAKALDLNIEVVNRAEEHPRKDEIYEFFYSQSYPLSLTDDIADIIDYCVDRICQHDAPVYALSLLTYSCQILTRWICAGIRQRKPDAKIVVGGSGIKKFVAEIHVNYCTTMRKMNLIDDFISGDGELALVEYLRGNKEYLGINTLDWTRIPDLNDNPYPDYDDYDFSQYSKKELPLNDSRGCVRDCEFCDIIEHWKKYQYRYADNIFAEMLYQSEKYEIKHFALRNSLVNGNMREFTKLVKLIADYNRDKERRNQISWAGYFIIRDIKHHKPELWEHMRDSNGEIWVGVESVIPKVRMEQMGKGFENQAIDDHLEHAKQYNIPILLLMIVAYPTETLEDFEYTKQWFRDRSRYARDPVFAVLLSLASILPETQLARKSKIYGIKQGDLPGIWINQNLNITVEDRKQYLKELDQVVRDSGFVTNTNYETLKHSNDEFDS